MSYLVRALQRQSNGQFIEVKEVNAGIASRAVISDLPVGVYRFVVAAVNSGGESESSQSPNAPVWDEAQARAWAFQAEMSEFLAVRKLNPMPYSFDSDGCSLPPVAKPLTPYDTRFVPACKRHDFGYQNFGRRLEIDQVEATKDEVNAQFLEDMQDICDAHPEWEQTTCEQTASFFQTTVDRSDGGFWNDEIWTWSETVDNPEP
jgi:hypothetical protein